jgi:hypothetical protein
MVREHAHELRRTDRPDRLGYHFPLGSFVRRRAINPSPGPRPQLHSLLALPAVDSGCPTACGVGAISNGAQQLVHGAEGNCVHKFSIARAKACANVIVTDRIGAMTYAPAAPAAAPDCQPRMVRRVQANPRAKN